MDTIVLDDFVSDDFVYHTYKFLDNLPWAYQSTANRNEFGVGDFRSFGINFLPMWEQLQQEENNLALLLQIVSKHLNIKGELKGIHANLQVYGQDSSWHRDNYGEGATNAILYYATMRWRTEWGGNLEIKENNDIRSYEYVPGRIIYMDGTKEHKANGPLVKNRGRISVVYSISKE